VHDHPGRLVHDEQVLILVGDPEFYRFRREFRRAHRRLVLDLLPASQPPALRGWITVDDHLPGLEQALGRGARANLREVGEKTVEPSPGRRVRNGD